jgi:hypothetical protein
LPLLTIFSETGFVALVVGLFTLAGAVTPVIVQGFQRRGERRRSARTKAIEIQLRVLYKPLLQILEPTPLVPEPDPMDWDDAVRPRVLDAYKVIDENLEYVPDELMRLLENYRSAVAYGGNVLSYEELTELHRYARGQFDQLRRELLMMPSEHRAFWLIRLWRWLGQKWHSWRAEKLYPPHKVKRPKGQ